MNWQLAHGPTLASLVDSWDWLQHPLSTLRAGEAVLEYGWLLSSGSCWYVARCIYTPGGETWRENLQASLDSSGANLISTVISTSSSE